MGRPGLTRHVKFRRLAADLGSKLVARGALELLWDSAYENGEAFLGDSRGVELAAEWDGEPGALTKALLSAGGNGNPGFIDEVSPGQYAVHDLFDHAPSYVLNRAKKESERKVPRHCEVCGGEFRSTEAHARFCSHACRQTSYRNRVTERDGASRHCDEGVTQCDAPPAPAPAPAPLEAKKNFSAGELTLTPPTGGKTRKPRTPTEADQVIAAYSAGFKKRTGAAATISDYGRAVIAVKKVIESKGLELAIELAREWGERPPQWNREHGVVDIFQLPSGVDKLMNRRREEGL